MGKRELTPWFDGRYFKPARRGVYMLLSCGTVGYQKWDGKRWGPWHFTVAAAAKCGAGNYAAWQYQNDKWRGLRKPPNAELTGANGKPLGSG